MVGYIYKFTLIPTGKIYIGKRQKANFDKNYWGSGIYWKRAVAQYGGISMVHREVLEWCETPEQLNQQEKYWIKKLDARNPKIGYNLAYGGDGGNLGEEAIAKMSTKLKGRQPWNLGKTDVYSNETRLKMSEAKKNKKTWNSGKSNIYTNETLLKMKNSAYNRKTHKKIYCVELHKIYNTTEEVCIALNFELNSNTKIKILRCCEGYRKEFNGLHFKFMEN